MELRIIGLAFKALDLAEDRGVFQTYYWQNNNSFPPHLREPKTSRKKPYGAFSDMVGFPIIVRPSICYWVDKE